jgi:hypothetical protein
LCVPSTAYRCYNWNYATGNLWPDAPTQRVSVILINIKENREYARYTYDKDIP